MNSTDMILTVVNDRSSLDEIKDAVRGYMAGKGWKKIDIPYEKVFGELFDSVLYELWKRRA